MTHPAGPFDALHEEAMGLAEEADRVLEQDAAGARSLYARALDLERRALGLLPPGTEPSRSVVLRSAATLALQAKDNRAARALIAEARAGDPPRALAEDLARLEAIIEGRG